MFKVYPFIFNYHIMDLYEQLFYVYQVDINRPIDLCPMFRIISFIFYNRAAFPVMTFDESGGGGAEIILRKLKLYCAIILCLLRRMKWAASITPNNDRTGGRNIHVLNGIRTQIYHVLTGCES